MVKDVTKACAKMAYEEDFGPKCSNGTDHTIAFTVNYKSCKLYVAVVGNGERRLPALCELDVYVNDTLAHHVSLANRFFTQKAVLLLPNTLHRGEHNVTIIGRQLQVGQTCNIASIFCV